MDPGFGLKLRELRINAGLTQADLASNDFTKGFISLVETGRTRVSLRAATILAARLGVSVADLLATSARDDRDLELLMLRGEQQLAAGKATDALASIAGALTKGSSGLRARALRVQGRALLDLGRADEALTKLEEATAAFEALGQRDLAVRTLYDRALAYARLDQAGNALTLALECESLMRARGFVDRTLELQLRSLMAATFARLGDNESADMQAQRALAMSDDVVDAEALGTLYSTLSVTRQREGDTTAALTYAKKSLVLFQDLHRHQEVGQLWHNLATVHLARKDYAKSEEALERAERIARESKIGSLEARLLGVRAQLSLARRRYEESRGYAQRAIEHAASSATTRGRAYVTLARGAAEKKAPLRDVRKSLEAAVKAFATESPRVRAEAHEAYATILAERGQWKDAYGEAMKTMELRRPTLR